MRSEFKASPYFFTSDGWYLTLGRDSLAANERRVRLYHGVAVAGPFRTRKALARWLDGHEFSGRASSTKRDYIPDEWVQKFGLKRI